LFSPGQPPSPYLCLSRWVWKFCFLAR
jgi:hypothetical protein